MNCRDCGKDKSSSWKPSYRNRCKKCYLLYWSKKNKTRKEYRRLWLLRQPEKKEARRQWMRRYYPKWYAENGRNRPDNYVEINLRWAEDHPEAVRAQQHLQRAVRAGKILRPTICSHCKREARIAAHHDDYTKPLDVKWLCSSCHKRVHTYKSLNLASFV